MAATLTSCDDLHFLTSGSVLVAGTRQRTVSRLVCGRRMVTSSAGSMASSPATPVAAPVRPVFLDATGRRSRWLGWAGRGTALLAFGYLLVVLSVLSGPPALRPAAGTLPLRDLAGLSAASPAPDTTDPTMARLAFSFTGRFGVAVAVAPAGASRAVAATTRAPERVGRTAPAVSPAATPGPPRP